MITLPSYVPIFPTFPKTLIKRYSRSHKCRQTQNPFIYGTLCALPLLAWALTGEASQVEAVKGQLRKAMVRGYRRYALHHRDFPAAIKDKVHPLTDTFSSSKPPRSVENWTILKEGLTRRRASLPWSRTAVRDNGRRSRPTCMCGTARWATYPRKRGSWTYSSGIGSTIGSIFSRGWNWLGIRTQQLEACLRTTN